MMGYSGWDMMGGGWGTFGFFGSLTWIVILVDLVLLGVWLWKKVSSK